MAQLSSRYGPSRKLPQSQSLYELGNGKARIYIRYSRLHSRSQAFFGLRLNDLRRLEGHRSFICFLWDRQAEPLFIPFADFEEVFAGSQPASDGQYKVQIYLRDDATILYVTRAGRFNVDAHFGWTALDEALEGFQSAPALSHPQVQTLLGAIGNAKQFDVWVPPQTGMASIGPSLGHIRVWSVCRLDTRQWNRFSRRSTLCGSSPGR